MRATTTGELNRIPDNARHAVKEKLESLKEKKLDTVPIVTEDETDEAAKRTNGISEEKLPVPLPSSEEQRILLEKCLQDAAVSSDERVLIEMSLEGYTQKEIANRLGISQPAISQRLEKLRQHVSPALKKKS
jgi:RNA polymerase sigma factor (sigma-70 family)